MLKPSGSTYNIHDCPLLSVNDIDNRAISAEQMPTVVYDLDVDVALGLLLL